MNGSKRYKTNIYSINNKFSFEKVQRLDHVKITHSPIFFDIKEKKISFISVN